MATFISKYDIGDMVMLITDSLRLKRIITIVKFSVGGTCCYLVSCGEVETWHYEFEMKLIEDPNHSNGIVSGFKIANT